MSSWGPRTTSELISKLLVPVPGTLGRRVVKTGKANGRWVVSLVLVMEGGDGGYVEELIDKAEGTTLDQALRALSANQKTREAGRETLPDVEPKKGAGG